VSDCESCHEREAVVHLTQIVGDQVSTVHLCSKCAGERGIQTEAEVAQTPLGAFLAAMGKGGAGATPVAVGELCPECGATLQDFRASGRVGCATCWTTFERPLRDLLRRLHGATRHSGEQYLDAGDGTPETELVRERTRLKEQLRQAILGEAFELAAQLRDQLRALDL
jgi:protein arginine kinase activator